MYLLMQHLTEYVVTYIYLPNASINGSLLPASLLNTILIVHCWFNRTDTNPVISFIFLIW